MASKALLLIHPMADEKIRTWVDLARTEISGVGVMEPVPEGWEKKGELRFYVKDVVLLKQWNTSGGTHLDPGPLDDWILEQQGGDVSKGINLFWWHSHVNFNVFWSSTDEACVTSFLGRGFLGSVVYNKRRESLARLDVMLNGVQIGVDAEMKVQPVTYNVKEECTKDFEELVTEGAAPKREWKSEKNKGRLEEVEEEEKKSRPGWPVNTRHPSGAYERQVWTRCAECPSREYCASPVIYRNQAGCLDRKELVVASALEKRHWVEAKKLGTLVQLQSWRDKRVKDIQTALEKHGMPTKTIIKVCQGTGCTEMISNQDKEEFELGYCRKCLASGHADFFA